MNGEWQVVNGVKSDSMATNAAIAHNNSTGLDNAYRSKNDGTIEDDLLNLGSHDTGRQSWRQIK